jgi:hypothetical protein
MKQIHNENTAASSNQSHKSYQQRGLMSRTKANVNFTHGSASLAGGKSCAQPLDKKLTILLSICQYVGYWTRNTAEGRSGNLLAHSSGYRTTVITILAVKSVGSRPSSQKFPSISIQLHTITSTSPPTTDIIPFLVNILAYSKPKFLKSLFPVGAKDFSLLHRVQTGSGAHPDAYTAGIGDKAAEAWSWPLTSI